MKYYGVDTGIPISKKNRLRNLPGSSHRLRKRKGFIYEKQLAKAKELSEWAINKSIESGDSKEQAEELFKLTILESE